MITNGPSDRDTNRTVPQGELARNAGIDVIIIGIGNTVNLIELSGITSSKHCYHRKDICFLFKSSIKNVMKHILGPLTKCESR